MATFFYGEKWEARLRNMGITDIPGDGSIPIPESLKEEVTVAREAYAKLVAPGILEWESFFLPILEKWANDTIDKHRLTDDEARLNFFEDLLNKYRLVFDDECEEIKVHLQEALGEISDLTKVKNEKLDFDAILRGSSSDGTKIGPCDEFDFKAKLHVKASDPVLRKFYPTLWTALTEYRQNQDQSKDLIIKGHCFHSARLLAIVFQWKGDFLVKVDLTPTAEGGEWKGTRNADPLGEKIQEQHFFILPGSDRQPPVECQPTLKPDTSYAESNTLKHTPPVLRDGVTLLKILINPCFTPKFCPNSPKGTDLTSYNLKDGTFWCIFKNGRAAYEIPNHTVKQITHAAVDILNNIKKREYFEVQPKEVKFHKAIKMIYKTLLLGRSTTHGGAFSLLERREDIGSSKKAFQSVMPQAHRRQMVAPRRKRENPLLDLTSPEYKEVDMYRVNTLKCLGEGGYGKVYEAFHVNTKEKVAAKEILLTFNEESNRKMVQEAEILSKITPHANVVKFVHKYRVGVYLWIFLELCSENLNEFSSKTEVSEEEKLRLMTQMAHGIEHLHTMDPPLAHRDVKPMNILVSHGNEFCIKITDFGMSKFADMNASSLHTFAGTKVYMAPEVFRDHSHSISVDIFSLGQVFYDFIAACLRTLKPLLVDGRPLGVWMCEEKWQKGEFPAPPIKYDFSASTGKTLLNSLVSGMLTAEPNSRPDIHAVLSELARIQEAVVRSRRTVSHRAGDEGPHSAIAGVSTNQENDTPVDGSPEHKDPQESAVQVAATPASGTGADALVVVGGHPGKKQINLECYIRAGLGWQHLTTTPEEQWNAALCGVGADSFVMVGRHYRRKKNHGHCQQYSVATGEWARRADMPTPRYSAGCVSDGCKVWVMGGNVNERKDAVPSDVCEVLDLSTGEWEHLPRMLQAVWRPIVCLLDRTILVLFNDTQKNAPTMRDGVRTLQALPCDGGGEWSERRPLPDSVGRTWAASAAACGACMYVVGGLDRLCERYDPTTDSWTHLSPPPRIHYYGAVAAVTGGRLVLAGGHETTTGDLAGSDAVDEYNVQTDTWVTAPYRLPVKVYDHGLVVCRV